MNKEVKDNYADDEDTIKAIAAISSRPNHISHVTLQIRCSNIKEKTWVERAYKARKQRTEIMHASVFTAH